MSLVHQHSLITVWLPRRTIVPWYWSLLSNQAPAPASPGPANQPNNFWVPYAAIAVPMTTRRIRSATSIVVSSFKVGSLDHREDGLPFLQHVGGQLRPVAPSRIPCRVDCPCRYEQDLTGPQRD